MHICVCMDHRKIHYDCEGQWKAWQCKKSISLIELPGCAQVVFARGHWKAPVWQGRFANMAQAGSDDDSLLVTWFLLEKPQLPGQAANLATTADGAHGTILRSVLRPRRDCPDACMTRVAVSGLRSWCAVSRSIAPHPAT